MRKIEIDLNEPLNPGDVVELHFRSIGLVWLQAAQIAMTKKHLSNNRQFEILSWEIPDTNKVIFTCRVKATNPVIVTVAVIAACITGVGIVAWLTLDKVYQIIGSPGSGLVFGSIGLIAVVVLAGLIIRFAKIK